MKKCWLLRSIFYVLLFLKSISFSICQAGAGKLPELPPISEEELKLFEEIFANMDDKTLEALAQIGEEYIKEMEAQGKDPYEIFKEPLIAPQPPVTPPATPKVPEKPTTPPIILYPPQKISEVRALFKELGQLLAAVQNKAHSVRTAKEMIAPWRYHIEDLIYYAHLFEQEQFGKLLLDKQEESTLTKIKNMVGALSLFDSLFVFPGESLEADRSYLVLGLPTNASFAEVQQAYQRALFDKNPELIKQQLAGKPAAELAKALEINSDELDAVNRAYQTISGREQALEALSKILETLQTAIYTDELLAQFKRIVQKLDPELIKNKEAQEKRESEARKEQEEIIRRRPPISPRIFEPSFGRPDSSYTPTGRFDRPYETPYMTPDSSRKKDDGFKPSTLPDKKSPDKKKDDKKDKKKDEKKEKDKDKKEKDGKGEEKKKPQLPETSKNVGKKLEKLLDLFEELSEYVTTKAFRTDGKPGEAQLAPKDLFTNAADYLAGGAYATPYDPENPALIRAKQMITALNKITELIHTIKKEARNVTGLDPKEKKEFKKGAQQLMQEYEPRIFKKDLAELAALTTTPDLLITVRGGEPKAISKDKKFIFFGVNEFGQEIESPAQKILRDLNPPVLPALEGEPAQSTNYIGQFKDAYASLLKELGQAAQQEPLPASSSAGAGLLKGM